MAVVATVTQRIDSGTGQLIVLIESLELDQKVLMDSLESSGKEEETDGYQSYQMNGGLAGGLEFVVEEETVSFLEIVKDNDSQSEVVHEPQVIFTSQDELGHFMVSEESTPKLQFLLGPGTISNQQQQLPLDVDRSKTK